MPTKAKKEASESQSAKPKRSARTKPAAEKADQTPPAPQSVLDLGPSEDGVAPAKESEAKNPYYRTIFMSVSSGFELGEDRRFKQRVFRFKEKPDDSVLSALRDSGFTYRPSEKAWTIRADYASRTVSDRLARQFADGAVKER